MILLIVLLTACGPQARDTSRDWHAVLAQKKELKRFAQGTAEWRIARSRYAAAVGAFLGRHPGHRRALLVINELETEFAGELSAAGRHSDAIRYYRSVLARKPDDEKALAGLRQALDDAVVSDEELATVLVGDSPSAVITKIGSPRPEWKKIERGGNVPVECWYFSSSDARIVSVCFRGGRVFALDSAR